MNAPSAPSAPASRAAIEETLASLPTRQQTICRNVDVLGRMVELGARMLSKANLTRERAEGQLSRLDRCQDRNEQRLHELLHELRPRR